MSDEYAVRLLCKTFAVGHSGYYEWKTQAPVRERRRKEFCERVAQIHAQSRGTYGSPRVTHALSLMGEKVGHNRVARAMQQRGIKGRSKKRFRVHTTDSHHNEPIAPNRLAANPAPTCPNKIWVSDLTYIRTSEGWLYLAGILDLYSRRLVGWAMTSSLETALPLAALQMALCHRQPPPGLILHSDRGVQYASAQYRHALQKNGLIASMSRRANCYDNATMESFWSTLKNELVYRSRFLTRAQAKSALFDYIERFYNRQRLHSSLGYKSPLDFESVSN